MESRRDACEPVLEPTRSALASILGDLRRARSRTDELFALVDEAHLYTRPIPERHRLVFYLGHLEAFDWNLLARDALGRGPHDGALDALFAFGIDPVAPADGGGARLPQDAPGDWPALGRVREYARAARGHLDAVLEEAASGAAAHGLGWTLAAAVEHRLMHAETLCYLLHALPLAAKRRPHAEPSLTARASGFRPVEPRRTVVPDGAITLGRPRGAAFGWDNEFEGVRVAVPAFEIDAFPVTNGEYAHFVEAGGYEQRELWDEADWRWQRSHGLRHPWTWSGTAGRWRRRDMFEERELQAHVPVHVSQAEASAYALWRGAALPSEAQWQRAAFGTPNGAERLHPWGDAPPRAEHGNFGFQSFDALPVGSHPLGASAFGVEDLVGDGWEWTRTPFGPLPGFVPQPFYPGYSTPYFEGRHFVLKGASQRTANAFLRPSFRNWFQPRFPHVYAKFRCVDG